MRAGEFETMEAISRAQDESCAFNLPLDRFSRDLSFVFSFRFLLELELTLVHDTSAGH